MAGVVLSRTFLGRHPLVLSQTCTGDAEERFVLTRTFALSALEAKGRFGVTCTSCQWRSERRG
jgi:hypothetical protein